MKHIQRRIHWFKSNTW